MLKFTLAVAAIVLAALVVCGWIGSRRHQSALAAQVDRLRNAAEGARAAGTQFRAEESGALPAPVSRYLRWAIGNVGDIREIRLRQVGALRTEADSQRWMTFEAEHLVVPHPPGFVWNAKVNVAPLLHVRVTDALVAGGGSGRVSFLSAFTVGEDADTPEMNSGSLHRYLAEAVWYPVARELISRMNVPRTRVAPPRP